MSKKTRKTLLIILIIILVVILALAISGFIAVRRSFPQIEGTLILPGFTDEIEIIYDRMGIPHIYASNETDLFMAQGYLHAQDRFFQMDLWRHIGAGSLAEMFGESQIDTDLFLRTMGWERVVEQELKQSEQEVHRFLQAYADGVNAYLADHQGVDLSLEYLVLGLLSPSYSPEPWEPQDTLLWAKVMAFDLGGNQEGWEDLIRAQAEKQLGPDRAKDLFPDYPDRHPLILPDPPFGERTQREKLSRFPNAMFEQALLKVLLDRLPAGSFYEAFGSNNWVIAGERTISGLPLLANDPHLSIQMPSIWYELGLHCLPVSDECRLNVIGFSFAGAPGVIIGHNDRIAWGLTNVGPDVVDLYIEKVNPENPNQYEVNGEWRDMTLVQEVIQVAGGEPIPLTVRYTRHGPVFSDVDERFKNLAEATSLQVPADFAISLRWTALEPTAVFRAILNLDLASDWDSFRDALRDFHVPSQNFIYADVEGNIGYQTPGRIPIRAAGDGLSPVPGWTDEYEWLEYIPFDELPSSFNPPQGYIVTANNAVVGPDYPYSISKSWDLGYRAARIVELIRAESKLSTEDMRAIQGDTFHPMGPILIPLLSSLPLDDPREKELVSRLENWDYLNEADSAEAALFNAFWRQLLLATFSDEASDFFPYGERGFLAIENLIEDPQNSWWDDINSSAVEDRDTIMAQAFSAAVDELEDQLGTNPDTWRWGELHTSTFTSQLGIGPLRLIFNRGPYPTSGGTSIVNNTAWAEDEDYQVRVLPSLRMIVDLSNLSNSIAIHTTGQSGHAFHRHYDDMIPLWVENQYYPMLWSKEQVEDHAEGHLILMPTQ